MYEKEGEGKRGRVGEGGGEKRGRKGEREGRKRREEEGGRENENKFHTNSIAEAISQRLLSPGHGP